MKPLRQILNEAFNFRNLLQLSPGTQFDEIKTHLKNYHMAILQHMKHDDLANMHDAKALDSNNGYSDTLYKQHKQSALKYSDEAQGHLALAKQMSMGLPPLVLIGLDNDAKREASVEWKQTKVPDTYRYYEPVRRSIPSE